MWVFFLVCEMYRVNTLIIIKLYIEENSQHC